MKNLKMGTTAMGIALGCILAAAGVLVMLIGFWKTLILLCLFGIGYFIGTVNNPGEFIRDKANKLIPDKNAQPINIKEEITREQTESTPVVTVESVKQPAETTKETEE